MESEEFNHRNEIGKALRERFYQYSNSGGRPCYYDFVRKKFKVGALEMTALLAQSHDWNFKSVSEVVYFEKAMLKVIDLDNKWQPNGPSIIREHGANVINNWQPSEFLPFADVSYAEAVVIAKPFIDWLDLALKDEFKREFILDFLAWRFQNPLNKVHHALYLFGKPGQGKGLFTGMLAKVFGETNVITVGKAADLVDKGAIDNWGRVFLVAEEIEVQLGGKIFNSLKAYTGVYSINTDKKYKDYEKFDIPAQLILCSNHAPTFLEDGERRFFVAEVDTGLEGGEKALYFQGYKDWLDLPDSMRAVATLLAARDLSGYRRAAEPPMTAEKRQALRSAVDESVRKIREILEDYPNVLLFEMKDFDRIWEDDRVSSNAQKHKLREAGLKPVDRVRVGTDRLSVWIRQNTALVQAGNASARIVGNDMDVCVGDCKRLTDFLADL